MEPSSNTALMASANVFATDTLSIFSICFSDGNGTVSVTTIARYVRIFQTVDRGFGEHTVGGRGPHLGRPLLMKQLGRFAKRARGIDLVIDQHAHTTPDVAHDIEGFDMTDTVDAAPFVNRRHVDVSGTAGRLFCHLGPTRVGRHHYEITGDFGLQVIHQKIYGRQVVYGAVKKALHLTGMQVD